MITFLSGGTGTPKLVAGARKMVDDSKITVVVNTAEDMWYQGGHLSPDIDTLMYLFSGSLNSDTWWGIKGDTFRTHEELLRLGFDSYLALGDLDRAVNLARAELMSSGMSLTQATEILCKRMGISAKLLPMTDTPVRSMIKTEGSLMHFQKYWVKHKGKPVVDDVVREYDVPPVAGYEVIEAIKKSEFVVIGPSNPITSIMPVLECDGVVQALKKNYVVAVSPFIGDEPVSGPAGDLMRARGYMPTSEGVWSIYSSFADLFVQDVRDKFEVEGALRCDTLMKDTSVATELFRKISESVSK